MRNIIALLFFLCLYGCKDSNTRDFEDVFRITKTTDVSNIKTHRQGSFDAEDWLTFNCNQSTVDSIVNSLGLTRDINPASITQLISYPPEWWDEKIIAKSTQYSGEKFSEHKRMLLWYNDSLKLVFYQQWWN